MEAFFVSTLAVGLAEVGDKTQFLAALLAARYRKPVVLCLALTVATLVNNALAAGLAELLRIFVRADALPWTLCICLIGLAAWALNAERYEEKPSARAGANANVFAVSFKAFLLCGLGGKAQVAAGVLVLNSQECVLSVAGATLGILLACLPAVWAGGVAGNLAEERLKCLPANTAHWGAALIYAVLAYIAVTKGGIALWFLTGKGAAA